MPPDTGDELRCLARRCRDASARPRCRQAGWLLCDVCDARARRLPLQLAQRYVWLGRSLVPGRRGEPERLASGKPGSRSPLSDAALHARDDVAALVIGSALWAVDELGLSEPLRGHELRRVRVGTRVLLVQWERLRPTRIGACLIDRGGRLVSDVDRVLGLDRLVHRLPAPCPRCDGMTLARIDGDELVRCSRCRAGWTAAEYRRLVLVLADELRRGSE